jgi:hypothetical protein
MVKRLTELSRPAEDQQIYSLPKGDLLGVFDGPVMLEDSCFAVDAISKRVQLKYPPAFEVRALMSL